VPWDYASVEGSGRNVRLNQFNQLTQVSVPGGFLTIGDVLTVGLAATNNSLVESTTTEQMSWGPAHYNGAATSDVNPETPYLAQYMFRQLPEESTALIGSSDVKHFWSSARSDYQHLNPGESDTYGAGLNMVQGDFFPGSDVDPATADVHRFDYFGQYQDVDVNGFNREHSRTYDNRLTHMLQVPVAALDPAQNPEGTRWFLMGCLWVAGDGDTSDNTRWVEVVPQLNGTSFTFTYPNGSGGQLDFRTIPGLTGGPGAPIGGSSHNVRVLPLDDASLGASLAIQTSVRADQLAIPATVGTLRQDQQAVASLDQVFAASAEPQTPTVVSVSHASAQSPVGSALDPLSGLQASWEI
jgi:hypothetical protein